MLKKGILLLTALVFAVVSHLRPVCRYELAGQAIAPGCGLRASLLAERTARAAAEEILRGEAAPSPLKRSLRLSLRRPAGDARRLSDALLRNTVGVVLRDEVRVDGRRLGWVRDGEALRDELTRYIRSTLPAWASGGVINGELTIRRLYTRDGFLTGQRDMLLLITGAAPVFYYDQTGRYARA